jgi:hypothetical protein
MTSDIGPTGGLQAFSEPGHRARLLSNTVTTLRVN